MFAWQIWNQRFIFSIFVGSEVLGGGASVLVGSGCLERKQTIAISLRVVVQFAVTTGMLDVELLRSWPLGLPCLAETLMLAGTWILSYLVSTGWGVSGGAPQETPGIPHTISPPNEEGRYIKLSAPALTKRHFFMFLRGDAICPSPY